MENTKHTQGEIKYRLLSGNDNEGTFIVYENEGQWVLFSIQYGKHLLYKTKAEAEANAQRIVKAVNMHNELVKRFEYCLTHSISDTYKNECLEFIKQAEGK